MSDMFRNRKYAAILRDFSGLKWGSISPSDIDAFLDFGNRAFVFVESKFKGAALKGGQRLALERLVDAVNMPSILIVAEHECALGGDIELGSNVVTEYRTGGRWHRPTRMIAVRVLIDSFLSRLSGMREYETAAASD